ncbi:hypothetical protein ACFFGT_16075 [Mucilaginibacter angelicae]|uniref:Lipoprotein n=1 Tax=Mucilaginibacter angelicae TaxID=869718 RepID=A0ABV6L8E0_9SPHI
MGKIKAINVHVLLPVQITLCLLVSSCRNNAIKRDFFLTMKESYKDVPIDSSGYFIRNFGLSSLSETILQKQYWYLNSKEGAYLYLNGLIRRDDQQIMFIPYDLTTPKEFKLFDFSCDVGANWKIYYDKLKRHNGDSVVFRGRFKENHELCYVFRIHPFYNKSDGAKYFYGHTIEVFVSNTNGIISISEPADDKFNFFRKLYLYPHEQFVNRLKNAEDL